MMTDEVTTIMVMMTNTMLIMLTQPLTRTARGAMMMLCWVAGGGEAGQ